MKTSLALSVLEEALSICRLEPAEPIPTWATCGTFFSITQTADELSVVCAEANVPTGVRCERGWRALKLEGPFDFGEIGVLAAVTVPLAEAGVSILAIATYDTDYVLVREAQLEQAVVALLQYGHNVLREER